MEELPIQAFKKSIMDCDSKYIIVEAETGSGKSTMVPQWFHEAGHCVLVTEPLIETVIGTSEYVAQLMNCQLGTTVGYRTGEFRKDSRNTEILFCTDGLALVREISGHNHFDVLVIDELHVWNTNQSTLEAWAWLHRDEFEKIIVLSATLNSQELSAKRDNAPVFKVPGRQFPIQDRDPGMKVADDVRMLVREGMDVLVFVPGEAEINALIKELEGVNAKLIPFSGKHDRKEKDLAYQSYSQCKVVISTNALETGRTLLPSQGRNLAVVDTGMERRVELVGGIEGLYLRPISFASGMQRRGRTGRVGPGVYIDHCPSAERSLFPVPEILRTRLDQTVLRLACQGYDAVELPFFHDLDHDVIADAKRALKALGAMDEKNNVTQMGHLMSRFPVSVSSARMIIEAEERGVVDEVLTIVSILENGSLRDRKGTWFRHTQERESDLLVELDLWVAASKMDFKDMRSVGLMANAYQRAIEHRRKLTEAMKSCRIRLGSTGDRTEILKSCVAGMVDHVYRYESGSYLNGGTQARRIAEESVLAYSNSPWVVGVPRDISFKNKRGFDVTLNLVTQVTKVDVNVLYEVAPQLFKVVEGADPQYDAGLDMVVTKSQLYFNRQLLKEVVDEAPNHPQAVALFAAWLVLQTYSFENLALDAVIRTNNVRKARAKELNQRAGKEVFTDADVVEYFTKALGTVARRVDLTNPAILTLPPLDPHKVNAVLADNPDHIAVLGVMHDVTYRAGYFGMQYPPQVELSSAFMDHERWKELPDEIRLPGGQLVEICLDGGRYMSTDVRAIKAQIQERISEEQLRKEALELLYTMAGLRRDGQWPNIPVHLRDQANGYRFASVPTYDVGFWVEDIRALQTQIANALTECNRKRDELKMTSNQPKPNTPKPVDPKSKFDESMSALLNQFSKRR